MNLKNIITSKMPQGFQYQEAVKDFDQISEHMQKFSVVLDRFCKVKDALRMMEVYGVNHIPVVELDRTVIGCVSKKGLNQQVARIQAETHNIREEVEGDTTIEMVMEFDYPKVYGTTKIKEVRKLLNDVEGICLLVINPKGQLLGTFTQDQLSISSDDQIKL